MDTKPLHPYIPYPSHPPSLDEYLSPLPTVRFNTAKPSTLNRLLFLLLSLAFFSCSFAQEFQRMEPPKVLSSIPNRPCLRASDVAEVRLRFSAPMGTQRTEEAFSLKANTTPMAGTFHWEEGYRILVFTPLFPLKDGETYNLSVSTVAEDKWGNSLQEAYNRTFHTKEETTPPVVITSSPGAGATVTHVLLPIEFTFSEPMDRDSIFRSFSLTPAVPGAFTFGSNSDSFVWTPMEPYRQGQPYQVTLRKDARDTSGNSLVEDYRFSFQVTKTESKTLSITCLSNGYPLTPTPPGTYVDPGLQIEKNESFRIRFTNPIEPERRDSLLSLYPNTAYRMEWNDSGSELLLSFREPLIWNTVYELQVLSSVYRFRVNGPLSIPPEVTRILYIPDTTAASPIYEELLFCHNYAFTDSAHAAFDAHLSVSPDASIDSSSFLSSFSIEAGNGCLELRLLRVEENPVSPPPKAYPPTQVGDILLKTQVFRVYCRITPVFSSGTVTFTLRRDLQDNLGNRLSRPYTLMVNKQ